MIKFTCTFPVLRYRCNFTISQSIWKIIKDIFVNVKSRVFILLTNTFFGIDTRVTKRDFTEAKSHGLLDDMSIRLQKFVTGLENKNYLYS